MLIVDDWTHPQGLPLLYLTTYSKHLVGAILIPGRYGLKNPAKKYPEYWHWEEFQEGKPATLLSLLNDPKYPKEQYGFHEQLWCGVFSSPQEPLSLICGQLDAHTFQPVLKAMPACAEICPSPFDLYDLFEEMKFTKYLNKRHEWQNPTQVNQDAAALEQMLKYLLFNYFRDLQLYTSSYP